MDIRKLFKKIASEWRKPEYTNKKKFILLEVIMVGTYLELMYLRYQCKISQELDFIGRWCVILSSGLGWLRYCSQEKYK